jgi:MarR family 2-MHQ and catechol resistance regulon transcriptional repressor
MAKIYKHSGKHLFIMLWRLYHTIEKIDHDCIREAGFSSQTDFAILEILEHLGAQTIKEIGDRVRLTSGSITTAIQRLEKLHWIRRESCVKDKRRTLIYLTSAGRHRILPSLDAHAEVLEKAFNRLGAEERAQFEALCLKLELDR